MRDAGVCTASTACTGTTCSCLVACSVDSVMRSDGSLWWYGSSGGAPTPVTNADGSLFRVVQFSTSFANGQFGCGVAPDGTVSCWNFTTCDGGAPCDTTFLGDGPDAAGSVNPVKVVKQDGTALANVVSVSVGWEGDVACAVDASGGLWCWGAAFDVVASVADAGYAKYAMPVLSGPSGPPLSGVTSVAVNTLRVCALKDDGSVWCWGNMDPIDGSTGTTTSAYPQSVPLPAPAKSLSIDEYDTCAVLGDTTIWCWGDTYFGIKNGTPTELLGPDAGPFESAIAVTVDETAAHAVSSNGELYVWTSDSVGPTGMLQPVGVVQAALGDASSTSIDDAFLL